MELGKLVFNWRLPASEREKQLEIGMPLDVCFVDSHEDITLHAFRPADPEPRADTLTVDDAEAIAQVDGVAQVAPQVSTMAVVVAGSSNTTTTVSGITPAFMPVRAYEIWRGSFVSEAEYAAGLRVAVLGSTTAEVAAFFGKADQARVGELLATLASLGQAAAQGGRYSVA